MEVNFCPCCVHCHTLKELEEKAAKVNQRRQDLDEERRLMEEELRAAERRVKKEGVIYGNHYELYTISDIQNITNYDFLEEMLGKIYPCGQPQSKEEHHELYDRYSVVSKRMNDLLIENLE